MPRVLVIEDEPDVAELLVYNLQSAGFETFACGTGQDGLRLGQEVHPDIVLLDLMLPDMSGMQVCSDTEVIAPYQRHSRCHSLRPKRGDRPGSGL